MDKHEMKVEESYSGCTLYINEEKNLRIAVTTCNQGVGSKRKYSVRVIEIDPATGNCKNGETVATRCNYDQAMSIAKEHYFK